MRPAVETASPFVQTPRAQMGGDGGSLDEKVEQAAPPQITKRHVQGDAPHAPNHQSSEFRVLMSQKTGQTDRT
jgi:hypothetical protein